MPPSLSSIQCFGALSRFRCFFGPRGMLGDLALPRLRCAQDSLPSCAACFVPRIRVWRARLRVASCYPACLASFLSLVIPSG